MTTTTARRLLLGLASATAAASLVVSSAVAADAADTYAATDAQGQITSFVIVADPQETQDLGHGDFGVWGRGNGICSVGPYYRAQSLGYVLPTGACGDELTRCARSLAATPHPGELAALEWHPAPGQRSGGSFTCVTEMWSDPALVVQAAWIVVAAQQAASSGG
jgi:hypothetical protein